MGLLPPARVAVTHQLQKQLVKKQYFDRTTNHHRELEFIEDLHIYIIEVLCEQDYRIKYEVYNDASSTEMKRGIIYTTTPDKNIVITSTDPDMTYFVMISVYTGNNDLVESQHHFISRDRALKSEEARRKTHEANTKYYEENKENLEEVVEYTSFTRATGTILAGNDLLTSLLSSQIQFTNPDDPIQDVNDLVNQ